MTSSEMIRLFPDLSCIHLQTRFKIIHMAANGNGGTSLDGDMSDISPEGRIAEEEEMGENISQRNHQ